MYHNSFKIVKTVTTSTGMVPSLSGCSVSDKEAFLNEMQAQKDMVFEVKNIKGIFFILFGCLLLAALAWLCEVWQLLPRGYLQARGSRIVHCICYLLRDISTCLKSKLQQLANWFKHWKTRSGTTEPWPERGASRPLTFSGRPRPVREAWPPLQ